MEGGQDLRDHQGHSHALEPAGADQHARPGSKAAQQRGRGEHDGADEEDPAPAVEVAEASAGDQPDGDGQ